MDPIKILVVEDELIIALNITDSLEQLGYKVVKCVSTYENAIQYLKECRPDIAILDIKLKGKKTGIDVAEYINEYQEIPFIFLTSITDKHIFSGAKKFNPSAYLIKPFTRDELFRSIELALHNFKLSNKYKNINNDDINDNGSIVVKVNNIYKKIRFSDILYIKSDHVYMELFTTDGSSYLVRSTLNSLLDKLSDNFIQVHRSYIVNKQRVGRRQGNELIINNVAIPMSRSFKGNF